jgi:hypothetical protein
MTLKKRSGLSWEKSVNWVRRQMPRQIRLVTQVDCFWLLALDVLHLGKKTQIEALILVPSISVYKRLRGCRKLEVSGQLGSIRSRAY